MSEELKKGWSDPKEIDGENFPQDTLGREKYAQFLTQFLEDQGYDPCTKKKKNYVLNLNSEWGSGKTFFLKRWSEDLKPHFPVVYIDAWQQDYSDDPLMTVISSVIKQLGKQSGIDIQKSNFPIPKKVFNLFKAAAPALVKTFSKKYFGEDFTDFSDVAADAVTHLLDEHEEKSQAIDDLKSSVAEWVSFVAKNSQDPKQYPAFIFIDELDRCRPSYAVEMLETIKHIFDIEGIVFVVATDTEQLQHAVKAIYGEGFDARLYLGRFFNSRFSLKAPDLKSFLEVHVDHAKLSGDFLDEKDIKILPPNSDGKVTLRNIAVILDAFKMPPRTAIQIANRVIATLSNMPEGSKIDILMLTTLLCINEQDNDLFRKVISGNFQYEDKDIKLEAFLNGKFNNEKHVFEFEIKVDKFRSAFHHHGYINKRVLDSQLHQHSRSDLKLLPKDYFQDLYLDFLGDRSSSSAAIKSIHPEPTTQSSFPIEEAINSLIQDNKINFEDEKKWFKAQYYLEKFNEIKKETYQDYVELASALDWIDGNSDDA